jgi:hypothetical protein
MAHRLTAEGLPTVNGSAQWSAAGVAPSGRGSPFALDWAGMKFAACNLRARAGAADQEDKLAIRFAGMTRDLERRARVRKSTPRCVHIKTTSRRTSQAYARDHFSRCR